MKPYPTSHWLLGFAILGAMSLPARAQLDNAPPALALNDTHYVLKDRQKFIELRGFSDYEGTLYDPDTFGCEITDQPDHGTLYWLGEKSYLYVPNANSSGVDDTFTFECGSTPLNTNGTVTLKLVSTNGFVMPHGLGPPEFGLMEEAPPVPDPWNDPVEGFYYVDPGDENATDEDNPNGTPGTPRLTIPTCLEAGDVVEVHGVSEPDAPLEIEAQGTEEDPIFIRGAGPLDRATLTHGIHLVGGYVIFEYIDFDASNEPQSPATGIWFQVSESYNDITEQWTGSDHIAIRHCSFMNHATGQPGVAAMLFGATHCANCNPPSPDNATTLVTDCVVYDTLVQNFGDWTTNGADYSAVGFEGNSQDMWCLDSVFHHIQSTGVGMSRNNALSLQAPAQRIFAGRNVIHHVSESPFNCKMTRNSIISQNKMYRVRLVESTSTGAGVSIDNDDHCNSKVNESGYHYSDNVWVIFNEIYDVQTGVFANQQIHCGGESATPNECCCPGCCAEEEYPDSCCDLESCCAPEDEGYEGPTYQDGRVYVVGNVFHHIEPFYEEPGDPEPGDSGQAVHVGRQMQVRLANNTISDCHQALQLTCTHNTGECPPPTGDPPLADTNGVIGITRNTWVTMVNNVILDIVEIDSNGFDVKVCTGPYSGKPDYPFTLSDGEFGFDHNLHYGTYRKFLIPSGPQPDGYDSVLDLRNDELTEYGMKSFGDDVTADNPHLENPAYVLFDQTEDSPDFMSTNGIRDKAYDQFAEEFPEFPHIYRDIDGNAYSGDTCAMGAYKKE